MKTPNESQLTAALLLAKEKTKIEKEISKLQSQLEQIDNKIAKALASGEVAKEAPKKAEKAPKAVKTPKAPKAPKAPTAPTAPEATKAPKEPKAPKTPKEPTAPKEPAAAKEPKAPKEGTTPKEPAQEKGENSQEPAPAKTGTHKGKVREMILAVLDKNPLGISVTEIAKAIGRTESNVYVWLSSAGKSIPEIKKISPGVYTYKKA